MKHIEGVKKPKSIKFDMHSEYASSNEEYGNKIQPQMTASQLRQHTIRTNWAASTNVIIHLISNLSS